MRPGRGCIAKAPLPPSCTKQTKRGGCTVSAMTTPEVPSVCFVGLSSTGPDPFRHQVFEVALIYPELFEIEAQWDGEGEAPEVEFGVEWNEQHWWISTDLATADAQTLRMRCYHQRHPLGFDNHDQLTVEKNKRVTDPEQFAAKFARLTASKHLVGRVDELFIRGALMPNGQIPMYYSPVDIAALAAGALYGKGEASALLTDGWMFDSVGSRLGIKLGTVGYEYTAMGEAKLSKAIWEAVTGK